MSNKNNGGFNYNNIPPGFYDHVLLDGKGIRSFWHYQKFDGVLRSLKEFNGEKIIDIGCSAGSFLGMLPQEKFTTQIGVDIAEAQIKYAKKYETNFRKFVQIDSTDFLTKNFPKNNFDTATLIEVIEHLEKDQIAKLFLQISHLLKSGGKFVITTPNYFSLWPFLELLMKYFVKPSYEEQHITKFTYFDFLKKIRKIYPDFDKNFAVEFITTSHFASFTLAAISPHLAKKISQKIDAKNWRMPLGALLIVKLRKI